MRNNTFVGHRARCTDEQTNGDVVFHSPLDALKRAGGEVDHTACGSRHHAHQALAHALEEAAHALLLGALYRLAHDARDAIEYTLSHITSFVLSRKASQKKLAKIETCKNLK